MTTSPSYAAHAAAGPQPAAVAALLRRAASRTQPPWLHVEVARRMAERLAVIRATPTLAIDWWSMLGGSRELLAARYPAARIEAVEPTAALAQRRAEAGRAPWWSPARWRAGPAVVLELDAPRDGRAQLLWSNMMLHWSADPAALFARWRDALAVDGFVMFSCFGPDTLRELRGLYRSAGWPAPGHAFIDMHDLGDALVHAGFADPVMDMERLTLTWADAGAMFAELRALGGNAHADRHQGLRTPRWRERLERATSMLAGADGRLALSFEIVYGHAFKPLPRAPVAAETRLSAETLRAMARAGSRATGV